VRWLVSDDDAKTAYMWWGGRKWKVAVGFWFRVLFLEDVRRTISWLSFHFWFSPRLSSHQHFILLLIILIITNLLFLCKMFYCSFVCTKRKKQILNHFLQTFTKEMLTCVHLKIVILLPPSHFKQKCYSNTKLYIHHTPLHCSPHTVPKYTIFCLIFNSFSLTSHSSLTLSLFSHQHFCLSRSHSSFTHRDSLCSLTHRRSLTHSRSHSLIERRSLTLWSLSLSSVSLR
jgi:hypothetical protein